MSHRIQLAVLALLISGISVQALAGSSRLSGPIIVTLTASHGVHLDDLLVVAAWALCMAWCVRQWRRNL
ncbi:MULTISPECIES: hypothetical protein [unclassified Nocardioides]|jgi:hypothetical protein|uniref:hypothetical protein n=1 Tax=unclassified Nocardioides TaxID=2615069 RepID=UPI0011529572|nr:MULTISPECIES: hypothetical protein [unclassified Nocardioides]TQK71234.1 hypothetical protein FBY23_3023 [Nocardioides sp. SLBN-35]WGY04599.1 hypothetical protein QI633_12690 [Nocardioides sp. QY071]